MPTCNLTSIMAAVASVIKAAGYPRTRYSYLPMDELADADAMDIRIFPGGPINNPGAQLEREARGRILWTYGVTVWVVKRLGPGPEVVTSEVDAVLRATETLAELLHDSYLSDAGAHIVAVEIDPYAEPRMLDEDGVCASAIRCGIELSEEG